MSTIRGVPVEVGDELRGNEGHFVVEYLLPDEDRIGVTFYRVQMFVPDKFKYAMLASEWEARMDHQTEDWKWWREVKAPPPPQALAPTPSRGTLNIQPRDEGGAIVMEGPVTPASPASGRRV